MKVKGKIKSIVGDVVKVEAVLSNKLHGSVGNDEETVIMTLNRGRWEKDFKEEMTFYFDITPEYELPRAV